MKRFLSIFSIALTCVIFLILSATSVQAAGERYWVGGTGNWSDDTNHWATSSGGSPGAGNLPTSSDNVFINPSSGFGAGGTITLDEDGFVKNFVSNSGHTFTINVPSKVLTFYGSVTFESGITISQGSASEFDFFTTTTGNKITMNGMNTAGVFYFGGTGSWELQDNLVLLNQFYQENGTFDANDKNITAGSFDFVANAGLIPTVIMGSGTWTTKDADWMIEEGGGELVVTVIPETSTIKFDSGGEFYGGGKTYWNYWGTAGGNILGSNIFNDIKIEPQGYAYGFEEGSTQTVTTFTATGGVENPIYLHTNTTTGRFNLSKSSGIVSCDYLDISNSNAAGGATWYAGTHSIDGGNNTGWIFEDAPTPTPTPTQTSNPSVAGAVSDGLGCGSHDCSNTATRLATNPVSNPSTTSTPTATGFQLFDIALTIDSAVLGKSSELIARTQFTSFGTVPTPVNMVYRIEDAGGNKVFSENDEVTVETEQLVTKDFKKLELKDGKYTLVLSTTYGDNVTDKFRQAFEVKGVATTKGISSNTIRIISIPIITGLAVFGTFLYIKRKQKMGT
jgi:hypothetical protein